MSDESFFDACHPDRSGTRPRDDVLSDFIINQLDPDLSSVPGIGLATIAILNGEGITTSYQLVGKFLSFKDKDIDAIEHIERFYRWYCALNISAGFRVATMFCLIEKLNTWYPGLNFSMSDLYTDVEN
jgi:hypothetical protein